MPHKHTRREKNEEAFDLPPTKIAKPLPPTTISKKKENEKNNKKRKPQQQKKGDDATQQNDAPKAKKRKRGDKNDDVPRAFKRLMAINEGRLPRSGLDNGDAPKGKKKGQDDKKKAAAAAAAAEAKEKEAREEKKAELKIMPGESIAEFNQRVDAALPISGLVTKTKLKDGKDPLGLKVRRTLKEKKMHNMYAEWRMIDQKVKEKREEELEALEEKEMENEAMGVSWRLEQEAGKKKKGKKRTRYIGEDNGPEGDPWAEIKKKRNEGKVGLNEVAHAPPELTKPRMNSLVRGAKVQVADIPKAAGSLRQREELQGIRENVVEQYRKLMEGRRQAMAEKGDD
ncbi:hypothetical protein QBC40DRAFT_235347 [Triangularia verruculosa]|uniref:Uncharacterized protein n=1 Tax=Triangularia verruculosa TaxID=2587418 RepID=A0AAN6X8I8_9PEZI|nr:hypothetical protein QBC40DRAFT_235347 [Triangularia verruculosa]